MGESSIKKQILVVDVPSTISAEEAEEMLNAVCEQGYFLRTITPESRAYFGLCWTPLEKRIDNVAGHAIAAIQQRMERVLRSKGPLGRTVLYKLTNGRRDGTVTWDAALGGLFTAHLIGTTEDRKYFWAKAEE